MTDSEIISSLLQLGEELVIKGDPDNAFICTLAASRLMALPNAIVQLHHPSGKVPDTTTDDIDRVVRYMYGKGIGE